MNRWIREPLLILLFLALTLWMTWPLALNLRIAMADSGDPLIIAWILDWDFFALLNRPGSLFDANVFHPAPLSLAFSDNLLGIALLFLPAYLAGAAPITIHNLALLSGFVLAGYAASILTRVLTGSMPAGIVGGIFYAFLSWRFTHLPHIHYHWTAWLASSLACLFWYSRRPSWKRAALGAFLFLMNGLTNLHWLAFGSIALAVSGLILLLRKENGLTLRAWSPYVVSIAIACVALIPVLLPYREAAKLYPMRGDSQETLAFSATLADWFVANPGARFYGMELGDRSIDPERWLFPGILPLLLAAVGLIWLHNEHRTTFLVIGAWILLGFLGSLGLNGFLHRTLFEYVEVFRGIRAPVRWAMIAYTGLAVAAGAGVIPIAGRMRSKAGAALAGLLGVLLVVELQLSPIRWYLMDPTAPPVYHWLARAPFSGAILELPLYPHRQVEFMFRSTVHHRPILNGISGFVPPITRSLQTIWEQTPIPGTFTRRIESMGTSIVVIHADQLGARSEDVRSWLQQSMRTGEMKYLGHFDHQIYGDFVFALSRREPDTARLRVPESRDPATRTSMDDLQRYLISETIPYNRSTFGVLDQPQPGAHLKGQTSFSGWALAPAGVREVNLLLGNRRLRVAAELSDSPFLLERMPGYPANSKPAFRVKFDKRPEGLRSQTDVLVEIVDGGGRRTYLPHVWFNWER